MEGDRMLKVRMSVELFESWCTRDEAGNRLRAELGEPDAEGFYCPTVTVDRTDNLLTPVEAKLSEVSTALVDAVQQLEAVPWKYTAIHANVCDDDARHNIHVWHDGESHDVWIPKAAVETARQALEKKAVE